MGDTSEIEMIARLSSAMSGCRSLVNDVIYKHEEYKKYTGKVHELQPNAYCFIQTASSTACGWGGIGGQAFTSFWVVCLDFYEIGIAVVYVGRAAYVCKSDEEFYNRIKNYNLPLWDETQRSKLKILWKAAR